MNKTLLTLLTLIFATSCVSTRIEPVPIVKLPTISERSGVDSSYTADRTDFVGTKYSASLTKESVILSRILGSPLNPGFKLQSEFNPIREQMIRTIFRPDNTSFIDEVYEKGIVSDRYYQDPASLNKYNIARLAELELLRDMNDIEPDSNLVKLRELYGPD